MNSGPTSATFVHGLLAGLARRWWLMPLGIVAGLVLVTIYLQRTPYYFSAELKIHPAPSSIGRSAPSPLGGLAALAGLGNRGGDAVSPFRFYLDGLNAPEVARRLARDKALMHTIFANEWDQEAQRWQEPASLSASLKSAVAGLFGLPQFGWQPPDANRLQGYISYAVVVRQSVKTPIVTIGHDHPDPVFAAAFLTRLHTTVDAYLREQQAARTRGNIDYLSAKLRTVTLAEQRQALVTALTEQERQAMLAFGAAPYAAEPFDVVTVSAEPTRPRPLPLLIGGGIAGLLLGAVLALLLDRRRTVHG